MPDEIVGAKEMGTGTASSTERAVGGSGLSFEEMLERELAKEAEAAATAANDRAARLGGAS